MIQTRAWREAQEEYKEFKKLHKDDDAKFDFSKQNALLTEYRLSEYAFQADMKMVRRHFEKTINSAMAQKIASNLWQGFHKLLFGNGNYIAYSFYFKTNTDNGIDWVNNMRYRFRDVNGYLADIPEYYVYLNNTKNYRHSV